jgi:putative acetyltransferase
MGDKIKIRPFTPTDQDKVKSLILDGLAEHFNTIDPRLNPDLNNIEESYLRQGSLFLVVEADQDLIGTGALIAESEDSGRIVRVSVAKSHRRLGIGRFITNSLINGAQNNHFGKILVETNEDWFEAIQLYQECGFTEYDRRDGEVHMMLRL